MEGRTVKALLLSSSAKRGGKCVAGVSLDTGELIRFVSEDKDTMGALTHTDMRCDDGHICGPCDVVIAPVIGPVPTTHQPENWLIDRQRRWNRVKTLTPGATVKCISVTRPRMIFDTWDICLTEELYPARSLELVEVEDLVFVQEPGKKSKVTFTYNGREYKKMSMTDRDYYSALNGTRIGRAILLMSLPEDDYNGKYFKFVAKIFKVGE